MALFADVISDIHLEKTTFTSYKNVIDFFPLKSRILIIAGDLVSAEHFDRGIAFLGVACAHYDVVFYILGNHEYYSPSGTFTMDGVLTRMRGLQTLFGNLRVLDNSWYVVESHKVVIFGATMWSNAEPKIFPTTIPIFTSDQHRITFEEWQSRHYTSRIALAKAIEFSKQHKCKLVVVTHYSPLITETLDPKHYGDSKNSMYCTDLSQYFTEIGLWIYGHTGFNTDLRKGNTRIFSNQSDSPGYRQVRVMLNE